MKRDPAFPQLEQALDAGVVGQALQQTLFGQPGGRMQVEACRVDEVRYKPGKSCVLSYLVTLRDNATTSTQALVVSGRLLHATERFPTGALASRRSTETAMLPQPAMRLWLFPADRKLRHLACLFDPAWLVCDLPITLRPLGFARQDQLANLRVDRVHYIPERSCMVRCDMEWLAAAAAQTSRIVLFAKQYVDDGGVATFSVMTQLQSQWRYGAQALRYDEETRTLWQLQAPGRTLTWALLLATDWGTTLDRIADCVVRLHQSAIRCDRAFGVAQICAQLEEAALLARELGSTIAERTRALVQRLVSQVDALYAEPTPIAPLHRDLKLINFLLDEDEARVSLIDLDCVELGDPVIDLGSLTGNVYLNGLRAGTDPEMIERVVSRLVTAYSARAPVSLRRLHWHIAAAMIYEVLRRSMRQRNTERLQHVEAYLQISARYCRQMEVGDAV
jgi:hypothetical protein